MIRAFVGAGGKTTLIHRQAELFRAEGKRVFVTTSTHMFTESDTVLSDDANTIIAELNRTGYVMACIPEGEKIRSLSPETYEQVCAQADVVLVEADGARRLPHKAHAAHEPVVPTESSQTIQVVGASGFGGRVGKVVHRPELMCAAVGCSQADECTPELYALFVATEHAAGVVRADDIVVNQADDQAGIELAARFAAALRACGDETPVAAGSVREHRLERV